MTIAKITVTIIFLIFSTFHFVSTNDDFGFLFKHVKGTCERYVWLTEDSQEYSPNNNPGNVFSAFSVRVSSDEILLAFGWRFFEEESRTVQLELWLYSISLGQWKNVRGGGHGDPLVGVYGSIGNYGPVLMPSARASVAPVKYDYSSGFPDEVLICFGQGISSSLEYVFLNDCWMYQPSGNVFKRLKGDNTNTGGEYSLQSRDFHDDNVPGGRQECGAIQISEELVFFFFGEGNNGLVVPDGDFTGYFLNDVWVFHKVNNQYKWLHGEGYGTGSGKLDDGKLGVYHPLNVPSGRKQALYWLKKSTGEVYIFGGLGIIFGNMRSSGDLWVYNTTANQFKLQQALEGIQKVEGNESIIETYPVPVV